MTLYTATAAEVTRRKAATADDLAAMFPEASLEQIVKALEYARGKGLVHRAGRVTRGAGRPATLYAAGPEPEPEEVKPLVSSVWELALLG